MHVNVSDILRQPEGTREEFTIGDERPVLEGLELAAPIFGKIRIISLKDGVAVNGRISVDITLECDRCLRAFTHHLEVPLDAEFSDHPNEDQFPIDKKGLIDLIEPIRQEVEVHRPLVALCQEDCGGIQ